MESDGTYMSDHQLFFLSDSYPKRLSISIICKRIHVRTGTDDRSGPKALGFLVLISITFGILPLSSLIPNIFSKEFLSLRHLILGNKDQSHASTHHKLWNKSLFSILSNSCLHLLCLLHCIFSCKACFFMSLRSSEISLF